MKYKLDYIQEKLNTLGVSSEDQNKIINDVGDIIELNVYNTLFEKLSEELKNVLQNKTIGEIEIYLKNHKQDLPKLEVKEIQNIADDTWDNYFASMS